jgi:TonB family protein
VLPFPATKVQPAMPAELVRKYPRAVILVYGLINTEGRMEQLAVKESPDASLNEPVLKALRDWVFRPAQRDGQTVAAKVLFGIPVWAAQ